MHNFYQFTIYFNNASKYYKQGAIICLGGGYGILFLRSEAKIASFQQILAKFKKKLSDPLYPADPFYPTLPYFTNKPHYAGPILIF